MLIIKLVIAFILGALCAKVYDLLRKTGEIKEKK